jgi:hypothetical protein
VKAQNKINPVILVSPDAVKTYQVTVDLGNGRWAELNFSERDMATAEYNRIKGQGIYCGAWIKEIQIRDVLE